MSSQIIEQFFVLTDAYLIGDLETMVNKIPAQPTGGVGYPSMQTILSGMELLGRILSGGLVNENAFNYFWDNHFVKDNVQYDNSRLKKIFRYSIRNGTAHYFLVKFGIQLSKNNRGNLTRTSRDELNIDIVTFYNDFKKTYSRIRDELLKSTDKKTLDDFEAGYNALIRDLQATKVDIQEYIKGILGYPVSEQLSTGDSGTGPWLRGTSTQMGGFQSNASITRLPLSNDESKSR